MAGVGLLRVASGCFGCFRYFRYFGHFGCFGYSGLFELCGFAKQNRTTCLLAYEASGRSGCREASGVSAALTY